MSDIAKIKVSGTTYNVKDLAAAVIDDTESAEDTCYSSDKTDTLLQAKQATLTAQSEVPLKTLTMIASDNLSYVLDGDKLKALLALLS